MNIPNLSGYLNQFQIFIKIAETGNLSRAARELGLTPSAVSKSLSQLESITGNLLINRESRPFQLTLDDPIHQLRSWLGGVMYWYGHWCRDYLYAHPGRGEGDLGLCFRYCPELSGDLLVAGSVSENADAD
ncbi:helix-turn-helix domain-containing protein [Pantoea coffeiphila]|uniref:helix-turn-helix domain-containing protein n=1 Tax=Pantoea coffeiphila TaxID=1465635 RepID=UPI00246800C0|nr:LysR family transcriptional regulator [Pantoea coffeiphila]